MTSHYSCDVARREVLRLGLYAGGLAALGVPMSLGGIARAAEAAASGRILVVVELSGVAVRPIRFLTASTAEVLSVTF